MNRSTAVGTALVALFSLLAPAAAHAGPLDGGRIPAEADGVGHIDMDALRKTALHRMWAPKVRADDWGDLDDAGPEVKALLRTLFDVAQGVSFWLTDADTGAVLIQVPDAKRIQALLDKIPYRKAIQVAGQVAYKYTFPDGKASFSDGGDNLAALVGNLLVLADDTKSLGRAIQAAAGRVKTLASARKLPEGARERGIFFFAALNDKLLDDIKGTAQSAMLRIDMSSLTIHVGEIRAQVGVRVKMMLTSVEEALKIKSMIDGVLALVSMSDAAKEVEPFTRGLKVSNNGRAVEISVSISVAEVVKLIESKT